ncbi:flavoprotein [Nocardiopsis composta]|uniref:Phosphopantothenoylcysteine synthetase/decarboxylase n=1 Tax=Nocardiopsis composta TaxID=157465 RepID=A0A7W8QP21_9ACTN|nr:flavoprotein [Nocardiopsis composta]MBB5433514.1 phosphopantothenoylcysteine synthetase/decarboxylase [Nocardiopsis composta]
MSTEKKTVYVVVCAAGPAGDVGKLIDMAHERGWDVQVIATPSALAFIDIEALEKQTGRPVRSEHRAPGSPRSPKADAIIVAPATFNTINKLANGIADNYALDITNEAIGLHVPITILPFVNSAYAGRHPFIRSIDTLRTEGVKLLLGPDVFTPHSTGSGHQAINNFPWVQAIEELD